jgi:hypothetical protein
MGETYTRQSSYNDGDVITAAHTTDEFDKLVLAFAATTGHTHDGTAAEGGPITKLLGNTLTFGAATAGTDITITFDGETSDGVLKWMEDEDYFEFSDDILIATTEKIQFRDTAIYINSSADGQLDLVADTEIQLAATTVDINGLVDISGNLTVGGNLAVTGNATVTGTTTFNGGTLTLGDSAADNVVFGADVDSNIIPDDDDTYDLGSASQEWRNLYIDGTANIDSLVADTADINGGTIDAAVIGGASAAAASVTTLAASGAITGSSTIIGTTITASTAFVPSISDGATLGTSALEFGDLYLGDSGVIYLGADQDVTLTHIPDTGVLVNSTNKIQFNDASQFIHGSSATVLSLGATDEIDLTATEIEINGTLDMNGAVDMSSTLATGGLYTAGAGITSTAAANTLGATSFNDADITNVGSIALDTIAADGSTISITGATTLSNTLTVGANDQGYDVILYGDTASANITWDTSVDDLIFSGAAGLIVPEGQLTLGSTAVTSTAAELNKLDGANVTVTEINIIDGDTSATATTVVDADRVVFNDAGTMKQVAVTDLAAYFDDEITAMPNLITTAATTVGALDSGSITSGFGTIDTGASAITTTGVITGGTLEATTDTAAGDNAAIGYTAAEGLVLTGQGSTSDVVIKNDADGTVFSIATGTTVGAFAGNVTVAGNLTVTGTTTTVDTVTMEAANAIVFEGATADDYETTLSIVDPTADHTQYLINQGGYVPLLAAITTTAITSTPEELNKLDGATVTTAEINLIDGDTARGTTAVASGDGLLINDAGTMRMTNVDTVSTYLAGHSVGGSNIVTTGALNAGSITSGFGTIDTGSSAITTTGLISGGSLDIDSVLINGSTIGHTDDTDLITVANGLVTVAGEVSLTTLDIGGTNVTSTAAELNIVDGNTSATGGTLADADRLIVNDNGTMVQETLSSLKTYLTSAGFTTATAAADDATALAIALG